MHIKEGYENPARNDGIMSLFDITVEEMLHIPNWLDFSYIGFSLLTLPVIVPFSFYKIYKLYRKNRPMNYGEQGDSRWATLDEIKSQYKAIPHSDDTYEGIAGFPISHYKDQYFIDTETHNTCIIGTSRSGKGESAVTVAIDIDSRAEEKASLVIGDPKEELLNGSYETLVDRGYRVLPFNIMNPEKSIAVNPLELIKRMYLLGNESKAEKYAGTLTNQIYYDPGAKDPFWNSSAANLIKAIILALLEKTHRDQEFEKFTMYNVALMLSKLGGETTIVDGVEVNKLDQYFKKLPDDHIAKNAYAQSNFATGNTRSSIFTVASGKLQIFMEQDVAKMTSQNTLDTRRFGFKKIIDVRFKPIFRFQKGYYYFEHTNEQGESIKTKSQKFELNAFSYTEIVYEDVLGDDVKIHFEIEDSDNVKQHMVYQMILPEEDKQVNTQDEMVQFHYLRDQSSHDVEPLFIQGSYSNKPIALFLVVPDYDSSRNVLATLFISQTYTLLAEMTSNRNVVPDGKCHNFVKFRLDEFGNLPAIVDFNQILTVCAGRRILFEAYVQAYSQIFGKYGQDDGTTIKSNFQNHVYILSTDPDTADEFSKKCGYFTKTKKQKNISDDSTKVSHTYSSEKQELILPQDLLMIHETHTVVIRSTKRQNLKRERIRAYPIFNQGETGMPFRWEFLDRSIDPSRYAEIEDLSDHKYYDLKDITFVFDKEEKQKQQRLTETLDDLMTEEPKHISETDKGELTSFHIEDMYITLICRLFSEAFHDVYDVDYEFSLRTTCKSVQSVEALQTELALYIETFSDDSSLEVDLDLLQNKLDKNIIANLNKGVNI